MFVTEIIIAVLLGILIVVLGAYVTHFSYSNYKIMKQRLESGDYFPEHNKKKVVFEVILYVYFAISIFTFSVNVFYRSSQILSNKYYVSIPTDSMSQAISSNAYLHIHDLKNQIPQYSIAVFDIDKKDDLQQYDIILFRKNDILIAHRIVEIKESGNYITQGDKNPQRDDFEVNKNEVLGKYSHTLQFMSFINYLGYTPGFYVALVGATYIIGATLFFDIKKSILLKRYPSEEKGED